MTFDSLGRAVAMYRRTATSRSAVVLLIANAIPLVSVRFLGWKLNRLEAESSPGRVRAMFRPPRS